MAVAAAACGIPVIGKSDWQSFVETGGQLKGLIGHRRTLEEKITLRSESDLDGCDLAKHFLHHLVQLGKGQWCMEFAGKRVAAPKPKPNRRRRGRPKASKIIDLEIGDSRSRSLLWALFQRLRSLDRDGEPSLMHAKLRG